MGRYRYDLGWNPMTGGLEWLAAALRNSRVEIMLRKIMAIVIAIIAGSIFNMLLVNLSHAVYPLPDGIDPNDLDALRAHVAAHGMPTGALILVLAAHAGGSFVSGLACGLIAKRSWYLAAVALGLLWMCGGIAMLMMLPAPIWFAVTDLVLYIPAALLGVKLGGALTARASAIGTS